MRIPERLRNWWERCDTAAHKFFDDMLDVNIEASQQKLYSLFRAGAIASAIVFAVNLLSIGHSSFGEWGDFFGGVLNPILTFLTFMGLLITIVLQQTELKQSRDEFTRSADALELQNQSIKKQSFESTFFQMLSLHNEIVNSIDLVTHNARHGDRVTRGRDCFSVFYRRLKGYYEAELRHDPNRDMVELIKKSYEEFWKNTQNELGHYFRYLFNIVRFVKESEFESRPYMRLIRAQLSDQEMLLLFYNCISQQGAAFRELAEEYGLLNNMRAEGLLDVRHVALISSSAFGLAEDDAASQH